jgi:2-dehydropantoate 2-reductase
MRILVYGAGNIGSLYAALLQESGQDVSILARGQRLSDIRDHGIRLANATNGTRTEVQLDVVDRLDVDDAYDLVLVVLPKHHVSEILPILAANRGTPSILFFGNNAAGPHEAVEALGRDRVLLGFPGAAAVSRDGGVRYLITSAREQPTTIGELDGTTSPRLEAIGEALRGAGFSTAICPNMDAWLKTHIAKVSPTANALYMAGMDHHRLARTRDALVLLVQAILEGFRVLNALDIPVTPANHRILQWLPEPLLLAIMRRMMDSDEMSIKIGHAAEARDEMRTIADEFQALSASTTVATPATDRLYQHLDPLTEPMTDGSDEIPLTWGGVWILGLGVVAAVAAVAIWSRSAL